MQIGSLIILSALIGYAVATVLSIPDETETATVRVQDIAPQPKHIDSALIIQQLRGEIRKLSNYNNELYNEAMNYRAIRQGYNRNEPETPHSTFKIDSIK